MDPHGHHHHHEHGHTHGIDECIEACIACYQHCQAAAMHHCLEEGGEHTRPAHFRLIMACAEMCRTTAHVMMTGYDGYAALCAVSADICERCAQDCARLEGMEECVAACLGCAHVCRSMA
jgi:hypothetical protein